MAEKGPEPVDTRPISAVLAIASYQLPVARDYAGGPALPQFSQPLPQDSVQISPEARKKAAEAAANIHLWGEVRFDPPHNDDPDLPWEAAHQEWVDLMTRVFAAEGQSESKDSATSAQPNKA